MDDVQDFKLLLNQKLAALVQEVCELFDKMIVQHEREKRALKQRNQRQQQLLDSVLKKPRVVLRRSDAQILSHYRMEVDPQLDKETESPHIKEEQEELSIKQEQEELQESIQPLVLLIKSEDEENKLVAENLSSLQKNGIGGPHWLSSDKQTPLHSNIVKHTENSLDLKDGTENTCDLSNSSPGLESISGHILSDSEVQTQVSSDTEDSDEWSPEPQVGQVRKGVILKSRLGKRFNNKRTLDSSTRKQNKSVNNEGSEVIFECAQCHRTFLRKTCSVKHPPDSTNRCSACSTRLKQGNSVRHPTVHGRKKLFVCKICRKSFTRPDNLSSHMLIHTGERPHCCTVCKKSFIEPGHLKAHTRIHTGEKPFSCSICKQSFTHRATRDRHERNHQGKRPFSCSECGTQFKQKAHYLSHLVVHSGERPFSCPVCKKTYTRKSHVTSHMMKVHKRNPN